MLHRRHILILSLLAIALTANAQYYNTVSSRCRHFLNLSVGGGIAEDFATSEFVSNKLGADGTFAFSYEIQKKFFFFNFGIGLDYTYTSQGVKHMVDQYERIDRDNEPIIYRYVYNNYKEGQHTLIGTVPIQFGFFLGQYVYLAIGAKASMPVLGFYKTNTEMYTEGEYIRFLQPISQNVPYYGYYPNAEYQYRGTFDPIFSLNVTPTFEVGGVIPLTEGRQKPIDLRLGAYVEYAVPIMNKTVSENLIIYDHVDLNPLTQNEADLRANIAFNTIPYSHFNSSVLDMGGMDLMLKKAQLFTVGIRATFRFDVTRPPKICRMCYD